MKKILFPYDFSKASINAFDYAVHFAKSIEASVTILHVYEPSKIDVGDYYRLLTENYELDDWGNLESFKAEVPKLKAVLQANNMPTLAISHLIEGGSPAKTITDTAILGKYDYIVMGTIGATGLSEIFLGSVTEKVLNEASCRVLAIPVNYQYQRVSNILYLTDFENYGFRKLESLLDFAKLFDAHVDVLQVKTHIAAGDNEILSKWRRRFSTENLEFHIHTGLNADEVVANFVEAAKISLIAISKHRKSLLRRLFLYSLSQQLAFHSKVPVLGLPHSHARPR